MKKWTKPEVIGIAVVAAVILGGIAFVSMDAPRPMGGTTTHYEVDVFSGRVNPGWTSEDEGGDPNLDLFTFDRAAGVPAVVPEDLGFRGVILTGPDLPGGAALNAIRVVPDGYYLEFASGSVRFVEDAAVWPPIRAALENNLEPAEWNAIASTDAAFG